MFVTLQPLEEVTLSGRGETVVYISGSEPLLLMASNKRAEIPSGSQITFPAFDQFTVQNKGESPVTAELLVVEGEFRSLAEGSTVRIQGIIDPVEVNEVQRIVEAVTANIANTVDIRQITETLKTEITNQITASIAGTVDIRTITETLKADVMNTVTANIANTVDIRTITETLKANVMNTVTANIANTVDIRQITETLKTIETPATSLATFQKTFTAGETYIIPANTNRRDVTIMASEDNTDTVTVAGIPLRAGQYVELTKYTGAVTAQAVSADDQIFITEVIK
ncbi:hypothetical protein ACFQ45_17495 [Rhodanobacter aciditrophus]|uniref:Uncharacterized protein n=1 Tax=Rhodanobacter aciditrophus TaxID=1623218 RepID=A0ABW4B4L2_9GAMM